jgi:hypothetical protein
MEEAHLKSTPTAFSPYGSASFFHMIRAGVCFLVCASVFTYFRLYPLWCVCECFLSIHDHLGKKPMPRLIKTENTSWHPRQSPRFHNICRECVFVECGCVKNGKLVQNATVCTEKLKKYTGNMYVYI